MRRIAIVAGVLVAIALLGAVGLSLLLDANRFKPELELELSKALGRNVTVGDLKLSVLSGSVAAANLAIGEDPRFGTTPFLQAKSLNVTAELVPLVFSRRLNVTAITIDDPEIVLLQSPTGVWNFSTLGNSSAKTTPAATDPVSNKTAPLELLVKAVALKNGRLTMGHTGSSRKPLILESVNLGVKDFGNATSFPFSISARVAGGGQIKLDGEAGPIAEPDASMTPFDVSLTIEGLDLNGTGLNSTAPDVAGLISLSGTGASDGTTVRIKGHLKAEKLKLLKNGTAAKVPVELDFEDHHGLRKNSGVIQRADTHIGKSNASLTGTYEEHTNSTELKLNLTGSDMSATDLAELIPALGITLPAGSSIQAGTLTVKLMSEGPADKLVTTGVLTLKSVRLAGFDLGKKMDAIQKLAGMNTSPNMEIQTATTNVRVAPDGITAQDIQLTVGGFGELTGQGTISPSNALDFKMTAVVHGAALTASLGNLTVPFTVEGSSSDPVFRPDMGALANTQIKKLETKAVGGFLNNLLNGKKKP